MLTLIQPSGIKFITSIRDETGKNTSGHEEFQQPFFSKIYEYCLLK